MNHFERVIKLHRLLNAHRARTFTLDDINEALDCTRATANRTIRRLRDEFGAPLVHDAERGGYRYESEACFEIPGLWFTAEELSALLILEEVLEQQPLGLLATTFTPLRQRLEALARRRGVRRPELGRQLRLLRMAARDSGPNFACVADALARSRRLRIDYHARSTDRMAPREVSPQRLTLYRDNWYLDAWCHSRNDLRTFALDRIIAAEPLEVPARKVDDATLDQVLATSYGIFAGVPSAEACLHFSAAVRPWIASECWHPQQQDETLEDGSLLRRLPFHHSEELVKDLLRHGADIQVLAPPALREAVRQQLRDALAQYEDTPDLVQSSSTPRIIRLRN